MQANTCVQRLTGLINALQPSDRDWRRTVADMVDGSNTSGKLPNKIDQCSGLSDPSIGMAARGTATVTRKN